MDAASLKKRLNTIEGRIEKLEAPLGYPMGFDIVKHLDSTYFRDSLLGEHPFLEPARNAEDYFERRAHFDSRRAGLAEQYKGIINREESNGQRWYAPFSTRIGIIADEFLYKSFVSTADFIPLTPKNFRDHVGQLDLVLVTTSWRGLAGEWVGASQQRSRIRKLIENELIPMYQDAGTPVAFYSKEDPPNFDVFLSTAKKCDYVFTSAVEKIPEYEKACPRAKAIEVLSFSVDHRHHNPVGSRKNRIDDVVFAGSWHNHKYHERRRSALQIFDGVIDSGRNLRIIDRNWSLDNEKYLFPERYLPYVEPAIKHDELLQIHRTSDLVINLNSVVGSSTMYANRVVELQAMGCTVLSNYSAGVNDQFPNVFMPDSAQETRSIIESLTPEHQYRNQMAGLRNVFTNHVNFDRIRQLLSVCGLAEASSPKPKVAVVGSLSTAQEFVDGQSYQEELPVFNSVEAARAAGIELACTLADGFDYGQHYLQDLLNATKYVASDVVFKAGESDDYKTHHSFTGDAEPNHGALRWLTPSSAAASTHGDAYRLDGFEVAERGRESLNVIQEPAVISVVIPIYNNGEHLEFKCFESLRRSSLFTQMEILLIDDGSTDPNTIRTVKNLAERFSNVRTYFFETGGSGSASRPRNHGLAMATADWITYLDPDNEALNDGYAKLLKLARDNGSDFAIGNMARNAVGRKLVNYVRILRKQIIQDEVAVDTYKVDESVLRKINFTPMSIQALVANTQWLRSLGIEQPVGAVGQDSYFFQQMLYYAKQISLLNEPIHMYFAAVSNSTVNSLGPKFYRKYIPLESARAEWLDSIGLLSEYRKRRMEKFTKGWYIDKLNRVAPEELEESKQLVVQLAEFYGAHQWEDPELKEFFDANKAPAGDILLNADERVGQERV
ncbi:glycosyltransferase [Glutamicibacter arilaitensis]|uniref:glycosyltransferase n=1 Tax=Glutamicibacter arilaitensis TaxID=256701 RepID=UPI003F8F97D1